MEKNDMPLCMRCNVPLRIDERFDLDEMENIIYVCDNCGAIHSYYSCPEEDKENYPYWSDEDADISTSGYGYDGLCPNCGNAIIWGADFMRSEVWGDVEDDSDDDSLASSVHCPHCGSSVDIIDCKPSEYKNYPLYNKTDETV